MVLYSSTIKLLFEVILVLCNTEKNAFDVCCSYTSDTDSRQ